MVGNDARRDWVGGLTYKNQEPALALIGGAARLADGRVSKVTGDG